MNRKDDKSLIVGLDIGTSKVVALVGEYSHGNPIEVIGIGSHESRGFKRGMVVDIESTVQSILRALQEAEMMAGCEISSVCASISCSHTHYRNSLDILPVKDGQIACAPATVENIVRCVNRCDLQVDNLILASIASSTAVLTADEKELGVVLVDIGAGTTDIAVLVQGAIRHLASLPIAGDQVTNDIAHLLRTPTPEAEQIKVRYACALARLAKTEESIKASSAGDRPPRRLARQALAEAVQNRYEEMFEMIQGELLRSGLEKLVSAGLVLTGGASKMEGVVELAEETLHMPVHMGIPRHVSGPREVVGNPAYATGIGLLLGDSSIQIKCG